VAAPAAGDVSARPIAAARRCAAAPRRRQRSAVAPNGEWPRLTMLVARPAVASRRSTARRRRHDQRHTSATLVLLQGVRPKIVRERLGHTTLGQTLDTYSHPLPSRQAKAARTLKEQLLAAPADQA
jgi:integrase